MKKCIYKEGKSNILEKSFSYFFFLCRNSCAMFIQKPQQINPIDKILPILSEVDIGSPIDTKNSQIKKYIKGTKRYKIISYDISSLAISSSASEIFLLDGLKNNSRRGISKKASKIGAYVKIPVELNEIYAKNGIERVRKYFKNLNFIFRKIKQIY